MLLPKELQNKKIIHIPNVVKKQKIDLENKKEFKKIVYLSRIDELKGQDFLINSFSKIAKKYPNWQIDIWGDVSSKKHFKKLNKQIKTLNLEKQIFFKGITKNSIETLKKYDFCVFPSFFEGWGFGLSEALSVGLPAIGLEECSAVNELIIDNYNGFLSPKNLNIFSKKIEILILNKNLRNQLAKNALESVKKYEKEKIDKLWLVDIEKIINNETLDKFTQTSLPEKTFPIEKIIKKENKYNFIQKIFSIKNEFIKSRKKKVLRFLGLKIILKKI